MGAAISVSVTNEPIIFPEDSINYGFFLSAFFLAPANRYYFRHHNHLYIYIIEKLQPSTKAVVLMTSK